MTQLGCAHVAPKYGDGTLDGGSDDVAGEGFTCIKLHMSPLYVTEYPGTTWGSTPTTLTELAQTTPFAAVFGDARLTTFVLNVWTFVNDTDNPWIAAASNDTGGAGRANLDAEEAEVKALAAHLLATYPGKTFIVQQSEVDWALLGEASESARLDAEVPPSRVDRAAAFFKRRQRGIEQARQEAAPTTTAKVLHGIEVNLVLDDWDVRFHRDCLAAVAPDVVGFSSYESIIAPVALGGAQAAMEVEIDRRLRAAHALVQDVMPGVQTYIGEFAWPEAESWFASQSLDVDSLVGRVVDTAAALGMLYCVFWTYRDNEEQSPGVPRGFYVRLPNGSLSAQGAAMITRL